MKNTRRKGSAFLCLIEKSKSAFILSFRSALGSHLFIGKEELLEESSNKSLNISWKVPWLCLRKWKGMPSLQFASWVLNVPNPYLSFLINNFRDTFLPGLPQHSDMELRGGHRRILHLPLPESMSFSPLNQRQHMFLRFYLKNQLKCSRIWDCGLPCFWVMMVLLAGAPLFE